MPQHSAITDPNLHEPKGVSTADASMVYVADGTGSGTWITIPTGWGNYADDAAEQTFNTTAAKLSVDGAGSGTTESYLPKEIRGTDSLWDATADAITPVAVGDAYTCRVNLPITSRTSANYAEVVFDIGGGATPSSIIATQRIETNRTPPFAQTFTIELFSLDVFLANGCQLFITTDTGSIGITAPSILISRSHGEYV